VPAIAWARLCHGGQSGTTFRHLYVERSIAAAFVERMHQLVGLLDVDDPLKAPTDIGPLISLQAARRVEDQVGRALREGARLILGGRRFRPSGLPGHFFQPTILTDVAAGSATTREEILGPVIAVTPAPDRGTALRLAAQAVPDCRVMIHTADVDGVLREVAAVALSSVRINDPPLGAMGPFAGLNHAAVLQSLGGVPAPLPGVRAVHHAARTEARPWWFPYSARRSA
jgi:acyl-CoA reductase-like NAD-dependent aldehyde dehydrogenase